jgi:plastocyanin
MIFRTKPLVIGIVSVVVLALIIIIATQKPATNGVASPTSPDGSQLTTPTPPAPVATPVISPSPTAPKSPASPSPSSGPAASPSTTPSAPKASISFTAPASGEKWVFGKSNTIQWNKDVGFAGEIYLISASDRSIVGWILTETGIHQTSYAWNTRDVYLSKTNPSKKTITTGDYMIKAVFSTNPKIEFTSASFSVIYENEVYIPTYVLTIKDYALLIPSLTVKKGDKITFINSDPVAHTLNLTTYSPFVIQPGASFTFDTSILTQGSYNFYSQQYPTLKLTVTVL